MYTLTPKTMPYRVGKDSFLLDVHRCSTDVLCFFLGVDRVESAWMPELR